MQGNGYIGFLRPEKHSGDISDVSSERIGSGGISRERVVMATCGVSEVRAQ